MEPTNQPANGQNKKLLYVLGGCLVIAICLICLGALAGGGIYGWYLFNQEQVADLSIATETADLPTVEYDTSPTPPLLPTDSPPSTEDPPTSTPPPSLDISPPPEIVQLHIPAQAFTDLETLFTADFPAQDYYETAVRLGKEPLSARTVDGPTYDLGHILTFQTDDEVLTAELMAITEHAYFWVDTRLDYRQEEIISAANRLEDEYYSRLINLFGQTWQPGVDNDPHFSILHLSGDTEGSELGYFSNVDEYPRELFQDSNEQEVVYLIMGPLELGSELYFGTLVHEIQHMIQWYMDSNEATWLNEGLSQLAEIYVGLETADSYDYLKQPDIRVNSWEYEDDSIDAHYGGAYLYSVYLWEQLGAEAIKELSRHPANGMAAVEAILKGHDPERDLVQFTADWAAANYLDDPAAGPRYYYRGLDFGHPDLELRLNEPDLDEVKTLNQFGVHYIDLDYRGESLVTFAGDTLAELIDSPPRSGDKMWFAPPMDESSLQLTAAFDLTDLDSATLKFSTWYDLEEDYDFAYISISPDEGLTWEILKPDQVPWGDFGFAFNGSSADRPDNQAGWIKDSLSLDQYIGQIVWIRFEVLTDSAVTGKGFALDDISIPELNYQTDAENGPDGWQAKGFVQTGWQIPQQWSVQLIEGGPKPTVIPLPLNEYNQGQWAFPIGKGGGVLVITPLTPFMDEPASYWLQIEE